MFVKNVWCAVQFHVLPIGRVTVGCVVIYIRIYWCSHDYALALIFQYFILVVHLLKNKTPPVTHDCLLVKRVNEYSISEFEFSLQPDKELSPKKTSLVLCFYLCFEALNIFGAWLYPNHAIAPAMPIRKYVLTRTFCRYEIHCNLSRNGHATSIAPRLLRTVRSSGVGPG